MIFVSDVHYQLDYLDSLPENKGPVVILGDLINWIDYRDGQGIAMDVFGKDNVKKLINLRKEHKFDERKTLWRELYKTDPDKVAKKMQSAIYKQYEDVFDVLKKYEVWFIPGNVDDVDIMNTYLSSSVKNVDGLIVEYDNKKIGFAGGGVPTPVNADPSPAYDVAVTTPVKNPSPSGLRVIPDPTRDCLLYTSPSPRDRG